MSFNDINFLKALRENKTVQLGGATIKQQNAKTLESARVTVNQPAKEFFDEAPKPSDFLLKKKEPRIINQVTFDERPTKIFEQNIPFSKPRSPQEIIEANLGSGFFERGGKSNPKIGIASGEGQGKVKGSRTDLQKDPLMAVSNALNSLIGGLFK
jgi:hypothetical protein